MDSIFQLLKDSRRANQLALDMEGRSPFCTPAIVTNNADPLNKRRIKVTLQSKGGKTETDWLYRLTPDPYSDPPVPRIGQTVAVMFFDGDAHSGCYLGVLTNSPNPEQSTDAPILDDARTIEGDRVESVGRNDSQRVEESQTIAVGKQLKLQNDAGASLTLHESGAVVLQDAFGNKLVLGGQSGGLGNPTDFQWNTVSGNCNWNLGGNALNIQNAADVTIAGKSVIVTGSTDSDSDVNNTRGY
jgi:hypothetical protein